jgi:hypothetical protein
MCVHGIELLRDNVVECRDNLLETFAEYLRLESLMTSTSQLPMFFPRTSFMVMPSPSRSVKSAHFAGLERHEISRLRRRIRP